MKYELETHIIDSDNPMTFCIAAEPVHDDWTDEEIDEYVSQHNDWLRSWLKEFREG